MPMKKEKVTLSPDLKAALRELARLEGLSLNALVTLLLRDAIALRLAQQNLCFFLLPATRNKTFAFFCSPHPKSEFGFPASLHFSHQLGASGLRISESRCAAATLAIEGRSPDADRV
jgi:hypothetical protein